MSCTPCITNSGNRSLFAPAGTGGEFVIDSLQNIQCSTFVCALNDVPDPTNNILMANYNNVIIKPSLSVPNVNCSSIQNVQTINGAKVVPPIGSISLGAGYTIIPTADGVVGFQQGNNISLTTVQDNTLIINATIPSRPFLTEYNYLSDYDAYAQPLSAGGTLIPGFTTDAVPGSVVINASAIVKGDGVHTMIWYMWIQVTDSATGQTTQIGRSACACDTSIVTGTLSCTAAFVIPENSGTHTFSVYVAQQDTEPSGTVTAPSWNVVQYPL